MRIAFYAPMKEPDHPVPSGDRQMARLLGAALRKGGHAVEVASTFRSFLPAPDAAQQAILFEEAAGEQARLAAAWAGASPPDLWFTYHNHYKAPDLLGPALARRLGVPYVLAEASHAPKRAAAWGSWHAAAEVATRAADLHLCFTARDRAGVVHLAKDKAHLVDLPPFIDGHDWPAPEAQAGSGVPRLVTVAMMRAGDKARSYACLADALLLLADEPWNMTVVGDGPARDGVRALFAALDPDRIAWTGELPRAGVARALAQADVYAWPGFGEAFGLGYLEAQAMGLPVVAFATSGVPSVVQPGRTGLLVSDPTPQAYASALRRLLQNPTARKAMGEAARAWVLDERTLGRAVPVITGALDAAMARVRGAA